MLLFSAAVKRLPSLPPEVVHKVLSDLQLSRVLHIICAHDLPYLDSCVTSHLDIGKILPQERLKEIKDFFTLYLDILRMHRHPGLHHPHILALECDAATFLNRGGKPHDVVLHIASAIFRKFTQYNTYYDALDLHAEELIPSFYLVDIANIESLRHFFEAMSAAETVMNKKKSDQLLRIVQLVKEYPRSLKALNDPSQEMRRNEQHLIDQLTTLSKSMLKPQILEKSFVGKRRFASHYLFLVPYDRLLRGFLKVLHRFPTHKHIYPRELDTVLDGMERIYVRDSCVDQDPRKGIVRTRTKYTPYAPEPAKKRGRRGGPRQPQFNSDCGWLEFQRIEDRIQPIDNRELVWLEAFLKICQYMSKMEEKWNADMTVSEYWSKHYNS